MARDYKHQPWNGWWWPFRSTASISINSSRDKKCELTSFAISLSLDAAGFSVAIGREVARDRSLAAALVAGLVLGELISELSFDVLDSHFQKDEMVQGDFCNA